MGCPGGVEDVYGVRPRRLELHSFFIVTMKQTIKYLAMLMVMLSFGLTSTSCGDDDDENLEGVNEETSLLVGSWVWDDDYEPEIWTFNSDGTCKRVVWCVEYPNDKSIETGKYRYDASTGILLMSGKSYKDENYTWTEKYKVLSISSLELILDDEGYIITFNRKI